MIEPKSTLHRSATRNTIGDALRRAARKHRERVALIFGERRWRYAELDRAVNRVARTLIDAGVQPGDRVGAYGRNSDAYALAWLACARVGAVHVPINYALGAEELDYILRQSGCRVLLNDVELALTADAVAEGAGIAIRGTFHGGADLDVLAAAGGEGDPGEPARSPEDAHVAQLLYTSGTTAAPKAAMMTHRALLSEYVSCLVELDIDRDDVQLAALPLYHSAQMHVFMMPALLVGAKVIIIPAPAAGECFELIEREKINSFFAPPTVWISLLRDPGFDRHDLTSLRRAYYGASIMPVPVLEELRERLPGVGVYNCYGQSEIAPLATVLRPEEHDARPSSAGRPVLNVETRIVDPRMNDMPPGEHGEIVHRSPQLLVGFWEKKEQTREAFEGGWFHSGDVGYMDEEGFLYVVDRIKDVINTGGIVVAGREVEDVLFKHPAVSEVAVIGVPDERWIEAVAAVVVLREGASATAEELIEHTRAHLAPFKLPKRVIFEKSLPRNTAGKILKRELRARFG
ncbi:MAG: acyl-CoA synthetase [Arenicellales bacterium]